MASTIQLHASSSEEGSQRGKRPLTIDLNYPAPCEELVLNTRFTWANSQQGQDEGHGWLGPQTSNDCVVIDEDIAFISPVIYAQSKNNSRRTLEVRDVVATSTEMHSGHSDWGAQIPQIPLHCQKRKRTLRNQAVLNWERHFSSEDSDKNKIEEVPSPQLPQSILSQEIPSFSCPICLGPLSEETSTKCGHIFCKMCIEASIKVQHKCPTCRKKLRMKDTIRVYLPTK